MTPSRAMTLPPETLPAPARTPVAAPTPVQVQALSLAEPLPGFPGHRDYVLVPAEDGGRLFWLQSVAPDGPRFLAVPAAAYFPDYAPALPGAVCVELGLANLRAPVVVNPATHRARQVVLLDAAHPIRRPLRR
jgi:flagellar assembly factor FliW